MKVKLGKLELKNPVVLASGTFDRSITQKIDVNKLGALVTKTITLSPRQGNPLPHIFKTKYGWLNSVGLKNVGLKKYLADELPFWQKYQTEIITSIAGKNPNEYLSLAKSLKNVVKTIEVDVSCPNTENFSTDIVKMARITKKVRQVFSGILIVKLPPDIYNIVNISSAILKAGADALTIANTYPGLELNKRKPVFQKGIAGYSGGAIKPLTLGMIWQVWKELRCPIIASGGIKNIQDVLDYLNSGAKAVQIGTANFLNPNISVKIIDELQRR
jgi:dihydroorotate dehydrogenase (NAD+) catalytic subunit